jgi:hypothetical protein
MAGITRGYQTAAGNNGLQKFKALQKMLNTKKNPRIQRSSLFFLFKIQEAANPQDRQPAHRKPKLETTERGRDHLKQAKQNRR